VSRTDGGGDEDDDDDDDDDDDNDDDDETLRRQQLQPSRVDVGLAESAFIIDQHPAPQKTFTTTPFLAAMTWPPRLLGKTRR
jgi:hypothetical protein